MCINAIKSNLYSSGMTVKVMQTPCGNSGNSGVGWNWLGLGLSLCAVTIPLFLFSYIAHLLNLLPIFTPFHTISLECHLLRSAQVETNIDSKWQRGRGSLKGVFKGQGCWGLPQRLLATVGCIRGSKIYTRSAHLRVVWGLLEIQRSRENWVDSS